MFWTIGTCHCPFFFCLVQRIHRVGKGFSVTRDGSQIISVVRDLAQINRVIRHSSVMCDFTTITRHVIFLWNFRDDWYHLKLGSIDIKNTKIWDKLLALFSCFLTSDFLRSNDKRVLVNVLIFYFIFPWCVIDTPPTLPPHPLCHPVFDVLPEDYFCALLPFESWGVHNISLFNSKQRSLYLVLFLLNILTHYPACCSTEG